MPTVIDALIVTLGLDAKNFNNAQLEAILALRRLEEKAKNSSHNIQRSGAGIVTFFNNVQHPFNALYQMFVRLATATDNTSPLQKNIKKLNEQSQEARRSGKNIQAGALEGASGLRVLGAAGLAAFTTFYALNKVMSEAKENAGNVFRTGVGAAGAGMGVRGFSAISQALKVSGNVPEEETQAWLAEYRQWRLRLNTSQGDPSRLTPLAETGAGLMPLTDTGEDVLTKLARTFTGLSDDEAIKRGGLAGLSATASLGLKKAGADLPSIAAKERERATRPEDVKSADDLLKSTNNLTIAWNDLTRIMWTALNPGIQKLADIIATIVGYLKPTANRELIKDSFIAALPGGPAYLAIRKAKEAIFGKGKTAPGDPATGATDTLGMDPSMAARLGVISKYESNNKNDMDKSGTSTAGGYYKITDPTWRDHAGAEVLAKYPRAIDAPPAVQAAIARKLWLARGYQPWEAMNDPARREEADAAARAVSKGVDIKPLSGMTRGVAIAPGGGGMGWGEIPVQKGNISLPFNKTFYEKSGPGNLSGIDPLEADISRIKPPRGRANIDIIRRAAAQQAAGGHPTINNNNHAGVNTGDINVHTQATDAAGTGGAVAGAIKRMVVESNTGLSG